MNNIPSYSSNSYSKLLFGSASKVDKPETTGASVKSVDVGNPLGLSPEALAELDAAFKAFKLDTACALAKEPTPWEGGTPAKINLTPIPSAASLFGKPISGSCLSMPGEPFVPNPYLLAAATQGTLGATPQTNRASVANAIAAFPRPPIEYTDSLSKK